MLCICKDLLSLSLILFIYFNDGSDKPNCHCYSTDVVELDDLS
jgi:hypothetical protein